MTDDEHKRDPTDDQEAQLTIRLPRLLHRQFKIISAMENRSMADLVVGWIRDHVRAFNPERLALQEPPREERIEDPHSRADKIRMILEFRSAGMSFGIIAEELNERGVLNLKSKPGWSKGAVYRVVTMESSKMAKQVQLWEKQPEKPKRKKDIFDGFDDEDQDTN